MPVWAFTVNGSEPDLPERVDIASPEGQELRRYLEPADIYLAIDTRRTATYARELICHSSAESG